MVGSCSHPRDRKLVGESEENVKTNFISPLDIATITAFETCCPFVWQTFGLQHHRYQVSDEQEMVEDRCEIAVLWKACAVVGGMYLFYLFELLLCWLTGRNHSHDVNVSCLLLQYQCSCVEFNGCAHDLKIVALCVSMLIQCVSYRTIINLQPQPSVCVSIELLSNFNLPQPSVMLIQCVSL